MRKHHSDLLNYITVLCIENIRKYLLSYAIVLGIAVGLYRLILPYNTYQFIIVDTSYDVFPFVFKLLRYFLMFVFIRNVSSIFDAMHDQRRATMFYTLPVSSANKFWGIFLFSFVGGVVLFFCVLILFMVFTSFISGISSKSLLENFFMRIVLEWVSQLMFAHSLFFLGAVFFKRRHFLYTIGVLTIFLVLFPLFVRSMFSREQIYWFSDLWYSVPSYFWYCIGAIVCWALAYVCYKRSNIH